MTLEAFIHKPGAPSPCPRQLRGGAANGAPVSLHLMQPLNQEIVNDHTKDIGHRSNRHDWQLHGQTAAHGQGDRMKDLLTSALDAHGGLSRWREIEAFQLKVSIGGGLLPA